MHARSEHSSDWNTVANSTKIIISIDDLIVDAVVTLDLFFDFQIFQCILVLFSELWRRIDVHDIGAWEFDHFLR
jgi:hypothetical protein